ncbi:MAG: hypothetical protein JW778_03130 [Candidatus Altiarchaeota archaeon]|nr:hypothetical protein [Candidatus Altiarchaeota archaeon]
MEVIRREACTITPEALARRVNSDLRTVQRCLNQMQRNGRLQQVTWEQLLLMGK